MKQSLLTKKTLAATTVFSSGAVVMIFELTGSRIIGPWAGTSLYVWSSLIGVIMASLSAGYWLGGRMADKHPTWALPGYTLLITTLFLIAATLLRHRLPALIWALLPSPAPAALLIAITLFAIPSLLLGAISPTIIRLMIQQITSAGTTAGDLYAFSTAGSIVGTFMAGFWLIPSLGSRNTLWLITIITALNALLLLLYARQNRGAASAGITLLLTLLLMATPQISPWGIDVDTPYNRVMIYNTINPDDGQEIKLMRINNESSAAMYLHSDSLVYNYLRYYHLAEALNPGFKNALMLGGAAYTYPMHYLRRYPLNTLDVVEIDPTLTELAQKHFNLQNNPRLHIFHQDGRTYLNNNAKKYDIIYGDAFRSRHTLPWQLITREAITRQYQSLTPEGCVLVNLIGTLSGPHSAFIQSAYKTYAAVFPQVYLAAVTNTPNTTQPYNIILVALRHHTPLPSSCPNSIINAMLGALHTIVPDKQWPILTDDYAPVDYLVNKK